MLETCIWNGPFGATLGAETCLTAVSNSGVITPSRTGGVSQEYPVRAEAYPAGKALCFSVDLKLVEECALDAKP